MKRKITRRIAELDPERDYQEIVYLLQSYEFPWDYERALEFALFRTYAVPAISGSAAKMVSGTPQASFGNAGQAPHLPGGLQNRRVGDVW